MQLPFPLAWSRAKTGFPPGEGGAERLCPIGIGHAQAGTAPADPGSASQLSQADDGYARVNPGRSAANQDVPAGTLCAIAPGVCILYRATPDVSRRHTIHGR